ncbi:GNAT family N-acetyltransferase [uncultured Roseibium sp.]|uniref:GNAT family N-acetyltransferase n=1 Tax=uncultured Roseibium sp. TaxID=1936171 RepID=UPI00261B6754|nr:GNAT family N-acetyltransferase [uncultured Roseibium sp.]
MKPVALNSKRLILRPPAGSDAERLFELIGNYEVSKMLSVVPHPYTMDDARWWLGQIASDDLAGECAFAIDDGTGLIGAVSLGRHGNEPTLGYWLGQPYWGKGYMMEAAGMALAWFFSVSDAQAIESGALDENPASMSVLTKLGFGHGVARDLNVRARGKVMASTRVFLGREEFVARETA